jgi:primosomal replication protein N''
MSASVPVLMKLCPGCANERPVDELYCEYSHADGRRCDYNLTDVRPQTAADGQAPASTDAPAPAGSGCANGHFMEPGDQICLTCGSEPATSAPPTSPVGETPISATVVGGWRVLSRLAPPERSPWERFIVEPEAGAGRALLTLYHEGCEPDPAVYEVLSRMPLDHVPEVLAKGRHQTFAYDVVEFVTGGSLADARQTLTLGSEFLRSLVTELGRALAEFAEAGLRHRDIRPKTILIRNINPLDLVVTGFGSARLSDFDLEAVAPLKLSRYSAPEAIVGAVSAASDWWALGMLVLECATRGDCFDGVNDQALLLHIVTRGMELPADLDPDIRLLLRGLLARDPLERWAWPQVQAWLAGESVDAPAEPGDNQQFGPPIMLAGREYRSAEVFAVAAAESVNWNEARDLTLRGTLAHWLEYAGKDRQVVAEVRRLAKEEELSEDLRHALALMAVNCDLPLVIEGEIVTPGWLLMHPEQGYDFVTGPVSRQLERMGRESWLVRLRTRAEAVRERARLLEVELEESRTRVALLASSRTNLEVERDRLRALFPDTEHNGLSSIMERGRLSDEDLIILVGAAITQFIPLATLVDATLDLAGRASVVIQSDQILQLLSRPRRAIFTAVDERTANFARCGIERVDEWADSFRIERRMPLPQAAVLLSVAQESWREPPKQQYLANLLEHFEKRVAGSISRGPLVRLTIGKSTPRVDVVELGTSGCTADAMVNHIIGRTDVQLTLDPSGYMSDEQVAVRLRRLVNQATTFRRDTGIDGRYMGFPFLVTRDGQSVIGSRTTRIAPMLLWPVTVEMTPGGGQRVRIAFDREREEVRLNPALESILGAADFARCKSARNELLARASLRVADVIDVLSHIATPSGRSIMRLPTKDRKALPGEMELVPAAVLFNGEFTGQAVAEDLRRIRGKPLAETVLGATLRMGDALEGTSVPPPSERDRYLTVEADPSQNDAVQRSRQPPGLVVEGPPGTGKSQTIVNIIANAIGHGETVLVVCQKQAALQVVKKRLEAEGLGERLFSLRDINKDRAELVTALRAQLDAMRSVPAGRTVGLRRQREDLAGRIETLERELDRHHEALQAVDQSTGFSYRAVLAELVRIEDLGPTVEAPRLRQVVESLSRGELSALEETNGPLARIWLDSGFEQSPLAVFRNFAVDNGIAELIRGDLVGFLKAEQKRIALASHADPGFETENPEVIRAWLSRESRLLEALEDAARQRLAKWLDIYRPVQGARSIGNSLLDSLEDLASSLANLDVGVQYPSVFDPLIAKADAELAKNIADLAVWTTKPTFFGRLHPARWGIRGRIRALADEFQLDVADESIKRLRAAAELEARLRPLRAQMASIRGPLGIIDPQEKNDLAGMRVAAYRLLSELRVTRDAAAAVFACPALDLATAAAQLSAHEAFAALGARLEAACARSDARRASLAALERLGEWVQVEHIDLWRRRILAGEDGASQVMGFVSVLGKLGSYQLFRLRAAALPDVALQVFVVLRNMEDTLKKVPPSELDGVIRRSIRREALLAAKVRLESARPELLYEGGELNARVANLARLDAEMREFNKAVLSDVLDRERIAPPASWEDITRLRGRRARSLREILDVGQDLGLLRLRPVWLMNPDVASRVLPLRARLFDLVIYDEASQIPVEYAVPTLFRAKRAVIAGDEKQMPPSNFFSASVDSDEIDAIDGEEVDEGATEAERMALEEGWNRREIKDCPDLLQLARSTLPVASLQIHYRSKYRELIGFSNAAFYGGSLSIPARHPQDEIRRALPIEVIRVDGVYGGQTNPEEVQRVVSLLEQYWARPATECPTLGVVTFNRKQADLIEDAVERRAAADDAFAAALRRERDRLQGGEDMGFFVKNVENVQGDERDVIIFSTTFGPDTRGTFRRNFGVLGSTGGERRLNVAITRAREKVILVTSIPTSDVSDWLSAGRPPSKPRDYLQAYLYHAERVHSADADSIKKATARLASRQPRQSANAEGGEHDGLALAVKKYVSELGHEPVSAQEVGDAFSMDFAVVDSRTGHFGLGIDCDAPTHPLLARARAREIWRRTVLAKAIPVLHRVSSRDWYHHPDEERARLRDAIQQAVVNRRQE